MARIRSVHPGQWTDEQFVECSPIARLFCIGLRNEADDQGVFEWKPTTLKMRLLPVDNVDVGDLLCQLEEHDQVKHFTHDGRQFGVIRNFCRYQRPKKPKCVYVLPAEFRTYVAIDARSTEPNDDEAPPVPPKAEIKPPKTPTVPKKREPAPQMEDEGGNGRRKEEGDSKEEFKNSLSEGIQDEDPFDIPDSLKGKRKPELLQSATFEAAREIAPRYDIYHIERCWREWNGPKLAEMKDLDKAFLGFVRKHVEANPI